MKRLNLKKKGEMDGQLPGINYNIPVLPPAPSSRIEIGNHRTRPPKRQKVTNN